MLLELSTKHDAVIERMANWGVSFDHFFDIGAAQGTWGHVIRRHWPESEIHFFEAAPPWKSQLEETRRAIGGKTNVNIQAVSDGDGVTYFRYDPGNVTGGAIVDAPGDNIIEVPKTKLDTYIRKNEVVGSFALKLDTHGAERRILWGATEFMKKCDFLIFETYNFGPSTRRFGQMAVFIEENFGLRCIDISEPLWRSYDNALWQLDLYFVRPENTKLAEWRI